MIQPISPVGLLQLCSDFLRKGRIEEVDCTCCACIIRANETEPRKVEARYVWVYKIGSIDYLCTNCCAIFRRNAFEDSTLEPSSIHEITSYQYSREMRSGRTTAEA